MHRRLKAPLLCALAALWAATSGSVVSVAHGVAHHHAAQRVTADDAGSVDHDDDGSAHHHEQVRDENGHDRHDLAASPGIAEVPEQTGDHDHPSFAARVRSHAVDPQPVIAAMVLVLLDAPVATSIAAPPSHEVEAARDGPPPGPPPRVRGPPTV